MSNLVFKPGLNDSYIWVNPSVKPFFTSDMHMWLLWFMMVLQSDQEISESWFRLIVVYK